MKPTPTSEQLNEESSITPLVNIKTEGNDYSSIDIDIDWNQFSAILNNQVKHQITDNFHLIFK